MPTTLLRGSTGASRRTSDSGTSASVSCTPTYSGSPASGTSTVSSAGMPRASTSPVTTPYWGSSPVVNLAMRIHRAYRRAAARPVPTLVAVETRTGVDLVVLDEATWAARRAAHEARVDTWVGAHLVRRRRGEKHPVEDFLFTYYAQRPAALRRWHPGFAVAVPGSSRLGVRRGYVQVSSSASLGPGPAMVTVSVDHLRSQAVLLSTLRTLLAATAARPPTLGCFGMHEWAMVYRLDADQVRHAAWPLRLGAPGTDEVVESHRVTCSHFDAFRFFTDAARVRNTLQPRSEDRPAYEQPGCLHAGMDLYKHAYRLSPMICSDLVADCFALARDIRVLDMRASPYDLSELGYSPVPIETVEGKQEYVAAQRQFAERGAPLRRRLVEECDRLLAVAQR